MPRSRRPVCRVLLVQILLLILFVPYKICIMHFPSLTCVISDVYIYINVYSCDTLMYRGYTYVRNISFPYFSSLENRFELNSCPTLSGSTTLTVLSCFDVITVIN